MVLYVYGGKLWGDMCPYVFPAISCFPPIWQLGRPSLVLQGRKNQHNIDNRGVIFLAFESKISGSRHKPKIWKIRWKAGKLSPAQIRLSKFGKEEGQRAKRADMMVGSLGGALSISHLPCSPTAPDGASGAADRPEDAKSDGPYGLLCIWMRTPWFDWDYVHKPLCSHKTSGGSK